MALAACARPIEISHIAAESKAFEDSLGVDMNYRTKKKVILEQRGKSHHASFVPRTRKIGSSYCLCVTLGKNILPARGMSLLCPARVTQVVPNAPRI